MDSTCALHSTLKSTTHQKYKTSRFVVRKQKQTFPVLGLQLSGCDSVIDFLIQKKLTTARHGFANCHVWLFFRLSYTLIDYSEFRVGNILQPLHFNVFHVALRFYLGLGGKRLRFTWLSLWLG